MDDDPKAAEKRAYAKGYTAGLRRSSAERTRQNHEARKRAFIDRALIALLPVAFGPDFNWGVTKNGKHEPYKTIEERIDFALKVANKTLERK
jgi:hypothetical protein